MRIEGFGLVLPFTFHGLNPFALKMRGVVADHL